MSELNKEYERTITNVILDTYIDEDKLLDGYHAQCLDIDIQNFSTRLASIEDCKQEALLYVNELISCLQELKEDLQK